MYSPLPTGLILKHSPIHGFGLFTERQLMRGEKLGTTHIIDFRFEDELIRTPLGGFINHSIIPNCELRANGDMYELWTMANIPPGTELTVKYTIYNPEQN